MSRGNVLLLGIVFAKEETPNRGQEFRDRVRCEGLEKQNYNVKTLDNKHSSVGIDKHCQADFADTRRMFRDMRLKWGADQTYNHIILDYFFSPIGWARERWGAKLFETTIPKFATEGMMVEGGRIWLPNLKCVQERILEFYDILSEYFDIWVETDEMLNPLYNATEDPEVEKELLRCPDVLINETQMATLYDFSDDPFYVLQIKREYANIPSASKPMTTSAATNNNKPIKTSSLQANDSDTTTSSDNESNSQSASTSEDSQKESRNRGSSNGSGKRTTNVDVEVNSGAGGSAKRVRQ